MLTHESKDYVVYRYNSHPEEAYQCHKGMWDDWERQAKANNVPLNVTKLVDNVTQNEARRFCQLTRED
jgi:stress response protein SCP2